MLGVLKARGKSRNHCGAFSAREFSLLHLHGAEAHTLRLPSISGSFSSRWISSPGLTLSANLTVHLVLLEAEDGVDFFADLRGGLEFVGTEIGCVGIDPEKGILFDPMFFGSREDGQRQAEGDDSCGIRGG